MSHKSGLNTQLSFQKISKEVQDSLAKANNVAEEAISTIRTVRSFANEDGEARDYANKLKATYKLRVKLAWVYAGYILSNQVTSYRAPLLDLSQESVVEVKQAICYATRQ